MTTSFFHTSLGLGIEKIPVKSSSEQFSLKIANCLIHSQYHPLESSEKQAEEILKKLSANKVSHLILLGHGLGYLIKAIKKLSSIEVITYEPFKEIFTHNLCKKEGSVFCDMDELLEHLKTLDSPSWRPYVHAHPGYESFTRFDVHCVTKYLKRSFFSGRQNPWSFLPIQRSLDNLAHLIETPGIDTLANAFQGQSAIIVGAGPSLKAAIPYLKKRKGGVLFSAIQAAPLLMEQDVEVDFITVADPADFSRFFSKVTKDFKGLILEASCYPPSFELFKDKTYCFNIRGDLLHQKLWDHNKKFEIQHPMATVSEAQTILAKLLGATRFIHIGCDYSWDKERYSYRPKNFDKESNAPSRAAFDAYNIHKNLVHTNAGYYHGYRFINYFFSQKDNAPLERFLFGNGLDIANAKHLNENQLEALLATLSPNTFQKPSAEDNLEKQYQFACAMLEDLANTPMENSNFIHQTLDDHGNLSILSAVDFLPLANKTLEKLKQRGLHDHTEN
ncbi:MAG: DUF115 domain-containing protein [Chlamydiales bacterium]|nr:DUF115 domain-containing protein [Chlamydiales bacterium]NCF71267.1 DUF115 domain-containing protein [Chlamydiales bacterium]